MDQSLVYAAMDFTDFNLIRFFDLKISSWLRSKY